MQQKIYADLAKTVPNEQRKPELPFMFSDYLTQSEPLQFRIALMMGQVPIGLDQIKEYAEKERMEYRPKPRPKGPVELYWLGTMLDNVTQIVDARMPAYFQFRGIPTEWFVQFGLDEESTLREVSVHNHIMFQQMLRFEKAEPNL